MTLARCLRFSQPWGSKASSEDFGAGQACKKTFRNRKSFSGGLQARKRISSVLFAAPGVEGPTLGSIFGPRGLLEKIIGGAEISFGVGGASEKNLAGPRRARARRARGAPARPGGAGALKPRAAAGRATGSDRGSLPALSPDPPLHSGGKGGRVMGVSGVLWGS